MSMNTQNLEKQAGAIARTSPLAGAVWRGRGRAPIGYIVGMAMVYARMVQHLRDKDPAALEMAKPFGLSAHDALAWYSYHDNTAATPQDRLRTLWALLIGLGMRESSGNMGAGRDVSARNESADTAEAGLFQMSWNITSAAPMIMTLFRLYYNAGEDYGLGSVFHEGVSIRASDWTNWGAAGSGREYQALAKGSPAFAAEAAAVGLRNLRSHWGPINRHEAEVLPEAVALLRKIEDLVLLPPRVPTVKPAGGFWAGLRKIVGA